MCQVVIPVLKELKTEHIDSICFDLITVLSLEGYIKGSNNYLGIKQQTSIRAVKRTDFPDLPAKYLSVRDFTLDFYDLYVKKNVGIFEETAAINLYLQINQEILFTTDCSSDIEPMKMEMFLHSACSLFCKLGKA